MATLLFFYGVLLQAGSIYGNAPTGLHKFATDTAGLGTSVLEIGVLFFGILILSGTGSTGIQKYVRGAIFTIGLGAMFLKTYGGIASGAMGLF